jgi:hypothetical protein
MTGYTSFITCRICNDRSEYMSAPKHGVCDECIRPVAASLCFSKLKVKITAEGVDADYWMRQAEDQVSLLMKRWKGSKTSDKGLVNKTCNHKRTEVRYHVKSDDSYSTWREAYTHCLNCGEEVNE